jgi:hypothetical protein
MVSPSFRPSHGCDSPEFGRSTPAEEKRSSRDTARKFRSPNGREDEPGTAAMGCLPDLIAPNGQDRPDVFRPWYSSGTISFHPCSTRYPRLVTPSVIPA